MTIALWKKLLVVVPAVLIVHLSATGILPLLEGLREVWEMQDAQSVRLGAAFPIGYGVAIPFALLVGEFALRWALTIALLLCFLGAVAFATLGNGFTSAFYSLIVSGIGAGLTLPVAARLLGLSSTVTHAFLMAALIAAAWALSVPMVEMFKQGLPVGGAPGWTAPYFVQAALVVVWLPLVVFTIPSRPPTRFR